MIVPVRGGPAVGAASKATAPAPVPEAPERIVSQSASETAVQPQSALEARTSIRPDPPAGSKLAAAWASVMVHSPAACTISARALLRTIAPRRIWGSGLATASNCTAPSPCPLVPDLMLSQALSDAADQAHSRAVVTATWPAPPLEGRGALATLTETAHFDTEPGEVMLVVADEPHAAVQASAAAAAMARTPVRQ